MSKARLQPLLQDRSEELLEGGPTSSNKEPGDRKYIVAVIQNRAKEVGLAALDLSNARTLWLGQYVEATRSFTNTLTMLEVHPPDTLLVVDAAGPPSGLSTVLGEFKTTPLPRSMWDDTEGLVMVQACANVARSSVPLATPQQYLAFGAAGALLKYMQEACGLALVAKSLDVVPIVTPYHVHIDAASIEALELVQPAAVGGTRAAAGTSLFKFLEGTRTRAGAQMLRANLLQPLREAATLNARYDLLDELRASEDLLMSVDGCLKQLPTNVDRVCGSLVVLPAKSDSGTMRRIAAMIQAFIQLRELLDALDPLVQALQGARCQLLCALRDMCSADALSQLLARLDGLLDEDVHSARSAFLNRTQQCFALRAGVNHMLDVCRQAFCKTTEAVHEHAAQLRETHDLPALKVQYTARRGFYLFVPGSGGVNSADNEDGQTRSKGRKRGAPAPRNAHDPQGARLRLPSSLTVLNTSARGAQCTTDELNALNARLQDAGDDCLRLTEETLDGVSLEILDEHLGTLHRLIDGLALLDMLAGFARRLEATGLKYVRPTLTESGPLALVECRHPVLELAEGRVTGGIFRPNDAWIAIDSSLHVITGPNMSGKSTYLRQVALAVVMAQVGCHVPATFASLCPVDRIFTRMGTADSLESGSSSFMVEMEETAYILHHATPRSLVLIDELGRATSTADGLGIAWAVAEALAAIGAPTLLATHFSDLAQLADLYPQCRAWHFKVDTSKQSMEYLWELEAGTSDDRHYGLALAEAVQVPEDVLERAKAVVSVLDAKEARRLATALTAEHAREEVAWEMVGKLLCLAQAFEKTGSEAELLRQVAALQQEAAQLLCEQL